MSPYGLFILRNGRADGEPGYYYGMFKGKTYRQILKELYALRRHGIRPSLGPTKRFLKVLGDPQKKIRCVQVAGTNGKGSTTAMIAGALREAGYRTGAYYSPHVSDFRERFLINGSFVSKRKIVEVLRWMDDEYTAALKDGRAPKKLTFFEWGTALAFCLFAREGVEAAVLETGMGGRFDATTAAAPEVCVITNISREHTDILGGTIADIAREKAGIIKRGATVVCGARQPSAISAIASAAKRNNAALFQLGRDFKIRGNTLVAADSARVPLRPGMAGRFQVVNAALAAQALLVQSAFDVTPGQTARGIALARLPGRFEIHRRGRAKVVFDVAHNPASVKELVLNLKGTGIKKCDFVFGVLADKDCRAMLKLLAPLAKRMWCVTPRDPRAADGPAVALAARKLGIDAAPAEPADIPLKGTLCVTGSFTTVELMKGAFRLP